MNKQKLLLCKIASCISAKKFKKLQELLSECKNNSIPSQLIYETILQSYLFNGFPAAINALTIFKKVYGNESLLKGENFSVQKFEKRGKTNLRFVYGNKTEKLVSLMQSLSEEFLQWMIIEGYGKVKGRKWLTLKDRELLNVAMLSTNYYEDQLKAHIRGALFTNNTVQEITESTNSTTEYNLKTNIKKAIRLINEQIV